MHIVIISLAVALVICVALLCLFGLFTHTALAHRVETRELR